MNYSRLVEDVIFESKCKGCGFKSKLWGVLQIVKNQKIILPMLSLCPKCKKKLDIKLIKNLTDIEIKI